jgi:hypothetical protein
LHSLAIAGAGPNPPTWPTSVAVFDSNSKDIEGACTAAYNINGGHEPSNHGQFSKSRFAFLFKPGTYDVNCPVGYYTQVLGLGATPDAVTFTSPKGVYSEEQDYSIGGALSTFWRSAENFKSAATQNWNVGKGMMWAVSQAAPLRRIEVVNDLALFEYQPPIPAAGEASGGYMANMKVGSTVKIHKKGARKSLGKVAPGSQQQWFSRDSTVSNFDGGVWNMVFSGVAGAPPSHCGNKATKSSSAAAGPYTTVDKTPTISEKPYITIDASGKYSLQIPPLKTGSSGANFDATGNTAVGFDKVYVTKPTDTAAIINTKLAAGLHVVMTPAIYQIDEPLMLNTKGQVLLGLGLATLVSSKQNVVIQVGNVDGVRVAGVLLQAGPVGASLGSAEGATAPALLQWGTGGFAGSASAPGFMHDVFARVGGPDGTPADPVAVDTMVHIKSGHVIGDNMWFWRADHATGGAVTYSSNACDHGLVVDGDDVTMYGLATEHTLKDLTLWNGERGSTYFYQSELPYGVTQAEFGDPGYAGYRVAKNVTQHQGWGVGVYSFFRDHNVTAKSGIVCPPALEKSFVNPLSVFLNGHGGIQHVINDKGGASTEGAGAGKTAVNYVC